MSTMAATGGPAHTRPTPSQRAFLGASALLFAASVAGTIAWCRSMSAMGVMPMPGGWSMTMTWMRMPGRTWPGAAIAFLGMWAVMMVAMMLPALLPTLRRYHAAVLRTPGARAGRLAALAGAGYFATWIAFGAAAYPAGAVLAALAMRQPGLARAVPAAIGAAVAIASALQLTRWKARRLACCRNTAGHRERPPAGTAGAWWLGVHLGLQCARCCGNLMVILLLLGVMDVAVMTAVAAAVTCERLAPPAWPVARVIGFAGVAAGLVLVARAAGLG